MIYLTKELVLYAHSEMIAQYGGTDGLREAGPLDSALNAPFQTFGGKELYSDIRLKAAVLCRSMICDHPFIDGNKRSGVHAMLSFLELNGICPQYTQAELIDLGLRVASGKADHNEIFDWLSSHA